jgi:hypothetical protein
MPRTCAMLKRKVGYTEEEISEARSRMNRMEV